MNIWTLGDAVVDLLPHGIMQYEACAGGAPVNVAVGAARLGRRSGFIGRVGNDTFGHFLHQTMTSEGVNTRHVEFDRHHHTSTVLVSLDQQGERQFDFLVNPSADQFLSQQALPDLQGDILHFCSLALAAPACCDTLTQAITQLQAARGILSFDLNIRRQMWHDEAQMFSAVTAFARQADIVKMSEEEWFWLTQSDDFTSAREYLAAFPARLKIVTCGARGVLVLWQDRCFCFGGYPVESLDTTGAGDAFMAGLLAAISQDGWPGTTQQLARLIGQASACGALATTQKGALSALPDQTCLSSFIDSHQPLQMEITR